MSENRSKSCNLCGSLLSTHKYPGLLQCEECTFVTADMSLSDEELKAIYQQSYFHGDEYSDYISEGKSLRKNFSLRLQDIIKVGELSAPINIFEIGCAYGFFLDAAKQFGKVSGIDISSDAVAHARDELRLDAHAGDYLHHDLEQSPNLIAIWDTIEHLSAPEQFLEKAYNDLVPGGILALTTGDISSLNARIRGANWRLIHPPTHLHYFTKESMRRFLVKCGFQDIHFSYPPVYRNFRSILQGVAPTFADSGLVEKIFEKNEFLDVSIGLNLFDIMFVIARK